MKREGTSNLPFHAWTGVILTLFLILMDQVTKLLALSQLKGNPDIILIPGVLQLKYLGKQRNGLWNASGKDSVADSFMPSVFLCIFVYLY